MPTQIEMCEACWLFYEHRTGGKNDAESNHIWMENALAWAITKHKIPSLMETPIDEWPNLSRVRGRWILWNTREGQPYQAELERLVAEYREPAPDYTDPAQAVRLVEIASGKFKRQFFVMSASFVADHDYYWTAMFDSAIRGQLGHSDTFGAAVLTACYNAIPEEEHK